MSRALSIDEKFLGARILIVDDEEINVRFLNRVLQKAGFQIVSGVNDARLALDEVASFKPDLVVLDLHMPWVDGFDILEKLRMNQPEGDYLPVLVLTGDMSSEVRLRALAAGARDFLYKPFDNTEVLLRIRNLLEFRHLHKSLADQNLELEIRVVERTREVEKAKYELLQRLALAAEFRDDVTGDHTRRVGIISHELALHCGMSLEDAEVIRLAAPLHDIGKIGISDNVLLKDQTLTSNEYSVMMLHTVMGARILSGSENPVMRKAEEIAATHHERWDGGGYPNGLKEEEIPLSGRVVSIADVFDALVHERPYKPAWAWADAVNEIRKESGKKFDPRLVAAFLQIEESGQLKVLLAQHEAGLNDIHIQRTDTPPEMFA
ncbi:two-component system response regulator [candidate division BRC1 bacterium HGW-BRC1-1]|jgi:putative two-component system response regulator|nr:MAG: two-component system response regulator [candidate division BRC1 bacterium HGW-BRC1-1]